MEQAQKRHYDKLEQERKQKEQEANEFLEQMHHNAQYENHTRQIEFEKKKKAREMLNEQIKENNEKKHKF